MLFQDPVRIEFYDSLVQLVELSIDCEEVLVELFTLVSVAVDAYSVSHVQTKDNIKSLCIFCLGFQSCPDPVSVVVKDTSAVVVHEETSLIIMAVVATSSVKVVAYRWYRKFLSVNEEEVAFWTNWECKVLGLNLRIFGNKMKIQAKL